MKPNHQINSKALSDLKAEVTDALIEYAEKFVSEVEDASPQGVTGELAGGNFMTPIVDEGDQLSLTVENRMEYAKYIEFGTEPFNPKLIQWHLSKKAIKQLGGMPWENKRTKVVVSKATGIIPEYEIGVVLAPVFMEWVQKVMNIQDEVKAYLTAWSIYRKIQKKGITAQHFYKRTADKMSKPQVVNQYFSGPDVGVDML